MLKESNTLDEKTKALIANTIFVNEGCGYRLQEGFVDKVNTYYDAQPQNRDFADGETVDVINQIQPFRRQLSPQCPLFQRYLEQPLQ